VDPAISAWAVPAASRADANRRTIGTAPRYRGESVGDGPRLLGYRRPVMATTRVLLLRHGQSTWNAAGRWQGQADPPLSDLGRAQASAAAAAIGAVDAVVTSDLYRAAETGALIAGPLGIGPVLVDERLRERHAGDWEGLTRAEIEAGWPGFLTDGRRPNGWEPIDDVAARAVAGLCAIHAELAGAEVLVVTHSGVIRAVEHAIGLDEHFHPNLGGTWVDIADGRVRMGERVMLIDHDAVAASMIE
jgi:probable phosphoglycerate mutase